MPKISKTCPQLWPGKYYFGDRILESDPAKTNTNVKELAGLNFQPRTSGSLILIIFFPNTWNPPTVLWMFLKKLPNTGMDITGVLDIHMLPKWVLLENLKTPSSNFAHIRKSFVMLLHFCLKVWLIIWKMKNK